MMLKDPAVIAVMMWEGGMLGSLIPVLASRPFAGRSVMVRSECVCGQRVPWLLLTPVLGWLVLRGRARCCGVRLQRRWVATEAALAVTFGASCLWLPTATAVLTMAAAAGVAGVTHLLLERYAARSGAGATGR